MIDRIKRINQLIKKKIADILLREMSFNRNFLVTIQNVDTSKDLKYTKIRISVMPFEKSEEILKILEKRTLYIQKELNKSIKIRFIPQIRFEIDKGEEKAGRIEKLLKEI